MSQELIAGNTLLVGIDLSAPQNFVYYIGGGFTAPLTSAVVGEGYVLIQNGARASSLAPLEVYREFPGNGTVSGTLAPSVMIGGTADFGSPSMPIAGHVQMAMQLDAQYLRDTRGRVDADLTLNLGQFPPFSASTPLLAAGVYTNREHAPIKAGSVPQSIFAGTPLEDFQVGTGGYAFHAYIPYRRSPVVQFRA